MEPIETSRLIYVPQCGGMREATEEELSYYGWDRQSFYYHEIEYQALQSERDHWMSEANRLEAELRELKEIVSAARKAAGLEPQERQTGGG